MPLSSLATAAMMAVALHAAASPAGLPPRFDLTCDLKISTAAKGVVDVEQGHDGFRIDLSRRIYCKEPCDQLRPIIELQRRRITLEDRRSQGLPAGLRITEVLVLPGLAFTSHLDAGPDFGVLTSGQCHLTPFSDMAGAAAAR